jgi:hypothetical protein
MSSDTLSCSSENRGNDADFEGIKKSLVINIEGIQYPRPFATAGKVPMLVLPGIVVDGVGLLHLPLSQEQLQALIKESCKAPFGKKNKTIVHKTWEIDGSKVSFNNSSWYEILNNLVKNVTYELGIGGGPANVDTELYKMLLYEQGAIYKPHQEYHIFRCHFVVMLTLYSTERSDTTLGKLIICLPSEHQGGEVRLQHGNEEMSFATADSSAIGISFIAW